MRTMIPGSTNPKSSALLAIYHSITASELIVELQKLKPGTIIFDREGNEIRKLQMSDDNEICYLVDG
jgi:hypothetical protein